MWRRGYDLDQSGDRVHTGYNPRPTNQSECEAPPTMGYDSVVDEPQFELRRFQVPTYANSNNLSCKPTYVQPSRHLSDEWPM
jgi:hypothetical protein